jgi:glutaredoxin
MRGLAQTPLAMRTCSRRKVALSLPRTAPEVMVASDILVYGADWCGLTRGVREYLTNSRFDYDYFDADRDGDANRFVLAVNDGHLRFPVVVVEDQVVTQPTIAILQRAINEHGLQPEIRRFAGSRRAPSKTPQAPVPRAGRERLVEDDLDLRTRAADAVHRKGTLSDETL